MIISSILAATAGFVAAHAAEIMVAAEVGFYMTLEVDEAKELHEAREELRTNDGDDRTLKEKAIDTVYDYAGPISYMGSWAALGMLQEAILYAIMTYKSRWSIFKFIKILLAGVVQPLIAPQYTLARLRFIFLWPAYTGNVFSYATGALSLT